MKTDNRDILLKATDEYRPIICASLNGKSLVDDCDYVNVEYKCAFYISMDRYDW